IYGRLGLSFGWLRKQRPMTFRPLAKSFAAGLCTDAGLRSIQGRSAEAGGFPLGTNFALKNRAVGKHLPQPSIARGAFGALRRGARSICLQGALGVDGDW